MTEPRSILVVDDEPLNLEILSEHLEDEGYRPVCAESGEAAWDLLQENKSVYSTILLDWMMPGISGLELLKKIKADDHWKSMPVIMQTAKTDQEFVMQGLNAGAYYYLGKPFKKNTLISIVKSAVEDYENWRTNGYAPQRASEDVDLPFESATLQSPKEAKALVDQIADALPDRPEICMGLTELLLNAIEHGNLGISYLEKGQLVSTGTWEDEIKRRLNHPAHRDKCVQVKLERSGDKLIFTIQDEGPGFEWEEFLDFSATRAYDAHGRGIAMANAMSFEKLDYQGTGNVVVATASL